MSRLNEANTQLNTLQQGDKITICGMGEFGFPYVINAKFNSAKIESYAQYDTTIKFIFTPKGKRSLRGLRIYDYSRMTIYTGWLNLNDNTYNEEQKGNGVTIKSSRYCSFDHRYINDIIKQTKIKPLVNIDPDEDAKEKLIYKVCNGGNNEQVFYSIDDLAKFYTIEGYNENMSVRKELRNQPILKGIGAPMWDGTRDEFGVIRYENYEH